MSSTVRRLHSPSQSPVFETQYIFVCLRLEKSFFLDLVLLRFTPQLLPTLFIDLLDSQLLILRLLHCHVPVSEFSTQWSSLTLLIFRTKQGTWYKQIQLVKGSDFLIILSSQHFIGNTFTHTALWELHTDESYLSQKEKAIFCLYQSSFSKWVQQSPT